MSEAVWLAIISSATNILALVISRWHSHREHRQTGIDVAEIKKLVNGKYPKL